MADLNDLNRFVAAQDDQDTIGHALDELRRGRKVGHWMWFVFPQINGLGQSAMSRRYGLNGLADARAYLAHPILGLRLRQCVHVLLDAPGDSAEAILGGIDATKLRSCLTLFLRAAPDEPIFAAALEKFFDGERDPETLMRL